MIDVIKQALAAATPGPWDFAVFEDSRHVIFDNTYLNRHIAEIVRGGVESEQREEDNAHLIANAPEWLQWQNERIERLEKALEDIGDEMTDDTSKRAQRINKIIMEALEGRNLYERSGQ